MSAANQALVTALNQNAVAYRALALAAAKQNTPAYGHAETALAGAGSGLEAAYDQLRRLGYQIG
jgi:signal transduction histidine kinase